MTKIRKRKVNAVALSDPKALTLVKSPSNKTSFKIIRQDGAKKKLLSAAISGVKRSQSALMSLSLPEGTTEEEAYSLLEEFGLGEEYVVALDEDSGVFYLKRSDYDTAKKDVDVVPILLQNGMTAELESSKFAARSDNISGNKGITVCGLSFNTNDISLVRSWLSENEIDYNPSKMVVDGDAISVIREDVDQEGKKPICVDDGVICYVVRSDKNDVPKSIARSVIEQAYGNYGYGHLDFFAGMADPEFTSKSWDGMDTLHEVLYNIILNSGLELKERKVLVKGALDSFYTYISSIMDALPTASSRQDNEVNRMNTAPKKQDNVVNKADADKTNNDKTGTESSEFVTRSELKDILKETVTAAMAEFSSSGSDEKNTTNSDNSDDGKQVNRGDAGTNAGGENSSANTEAKSDSQVLDMEKLANLVVSKLSSRMDSMDNEIKSLKETTSVVREDDLDSDDRDDDDDREQTIEEKTFAGMFDRV